MGWIRHHKHKRLSRFCASGERSHSAPMQSSIMSRTAAITENFVALMRSLVTMAGVAYCDQIIRHVPLTTLVPEPVS